MLDEPQQRARPRPTSAASQAMARYAAGDSAAFEQVYDAMAPRLANYFRRTISDGSAVDDLLQQVFLHIHLARGRFTQGSRIEPWAFTIARAVAMDWLRRHYRKSAGQPSDSAKATHPEEAMMGALEGELTEALREELAGLSPKLREAFLLVRIDELTHAEAAQVLGIEESATKLRTHRAGLRLRKKLSRFFASVTTDE